MAAGDIENETEQQGSEQQDIFTRVLGGGARVRILSALLGDYDRDLNASEISRQADIDRATFYRHIDDLRAWGLVEQTREVGNSKMYQINQESDAAKQLARFEWELIEHLAEKEDADEVDEDNWPVIRAD